ncbi:DNA recombination protein RmuC [Thermodesulfobacteriota bacterium]
MDWLPLIIALTLGFMLGIAVSFILRLIHSKTAKQMADEFYRDTEKWRKESLDSVLKDMKASFGNLSLKTLAISTEEFLKLAKARLETEREIGVKELDSKKGLIDEQLRNMTAELEKVSGLVKELEKDRIEKFGELTSQLESARKQTEVLTETTTSLNKALASTNVRGQWGERMAEDVLRLAGFIENVNYLKQKAIEGVGTRPDFTFLLPRDLKLNMDVKFPLVNYLKYLESESDIERKKFCNDFLKDVKARIKEVTTREYISPEENTLDYVLLFIPNEQIYAFIHEQDSTILDNGIINKVVLCSPLTLLAVLGVIRQAVDNFALEKTSNQILILLGTFYKQWELFLNRLKTMGKRIDDAQKEYEALTSTRRRQLEKPLKKIEELRAQRHISIEQAPADIIALEDDISDEPD